MHFNAYEVIILLFATIGPLKVTIVCAALTADAPEEFLKQVASRSVVAATVVCLLFAVLGEIILGLFKVSIPAFQIGGSIIVLLSAIDMVMGDKDKNKNNVSAVKDAGPSPDIAIYPLAVPMMASVSGLVAIVSVLAQGIGLWQVLFLAAVIVGIMAINYVCLRLCRLLVRVAGPAAIRVTGKIMGVILTALAVELMLMGLRGLGVLTQIG